MSRRSRRPIGAVRPRRAVLLVAVALAAVVACRGTALRPATAERPSAVRVRFEPESTHYADAARIYDSLWVHDGPRMVQALEAAAGLRFSALGDTSIRAIIIGGPSNSGYRERPMRLRGSYPLETKKATLMHELGHRLGAGVFRPDDNEHAMLFLWLFEAWERAYGTTFAHTEVAVEKRRGGIYPGAWDAALALPPAARAARWDSIKAARR